VWQAEDGRIFEDEQECKKYEASDKVMRLLYEMDGSKRLWEDASDLEYLLDEHYRECGFPFTNQMDTLRWLWRVSVNRGELLGHARYLEEVAVYLKRISGE
jgi:hypothetical protein